MGRTRRFSMDTVGSRSASFRTIRAASAQDGSRGRGLSRSSRTVRHRGCPLAFLFVITVRAAAASSAAAAAATASSAAAAPGGGGGGGGGSLVAVMLATFFTSLLSGCSAAFP